MKHANLLIICSLKFCQFLIEFCTNNMCPPLFLTIWYKLIFFLNWKFLCVSHVLLFMSLEMSQDLLKRIYDFYSWMHALDLINILWNLYAEFYRNKAYSMLKTIYLWPWVIIHARIRACNEDVLWITSHWKNNEKEKTALKAEKYIFNLNKTKLTYVTYNDRRLFPIKMVQSQNWFVYRDIKMLYNLINWSIFNFKHLLFLTYMLASTSQRVVHENDLWY